MVEAIDVAAPIVAVGAAFILYVLIGRSNLLADADWWETARRRVLPQLNRFARRNGLGYAAYELSEREFAGRLEIDPEETETVLEALGFARMPLAAFKYAPDGRSEVGSWAKRDGLFARRQLHVMLFEADDAGTDLYAHDEYNAFNPATAAQHYLGISYDPTAGVERVRTLIRTRTDHELERAV